jgi:hypothetical protein
VSNYTKATNFAVKDGLAQGDPGKIVKGTEIDTEFNNIATAISTKADTNSPTFTGAPLAPTATGTTNNTQIATTAFVQTAASSAASTSITTERTASATLTNKTINLANNTVTGTIAQFNTALSDANFATLTGSETLTNKTINASQLVNESVTADKLASGSVTQSKLAAATTTLPSVVCANTGTDQSFSVAVWTTANLSTKIVDSVSATLSSNVLTLPAGTYYFEVSTPIRCSGSDTITNAYNAIYNSSGSEIAKGGVSQVGDWSTSFVTGYGSFTLGSSTGIVVKVFVSDSPTPWIDGISGYCSTILKLWKTA